MTASESGKIMKDFYLSPSYDPHAARPADVVQAAIEFALITRATCNATLQVPAEPSGEVRERVEEALREAYIAGATDVHRFVSEGGEIPRGDPEFGEAALDFAKAALDPLSSAARGLDLASLLAPAIDGREVAERAAVLLEAAIADGYPGPTKKVDQCEHGKYGWEDCIACYDEALTGVVIAIRKLAPTPSEGGAK